ncbi:MAG: hypothetical protein AAB799_00330 [Patescibacteria group bacterium]
MMLVWVFCIFTARLAVAGQEEQQLLSARPLPVVAVYLPDVRPSHELPKNKVQEKKKDSFLFAIDFPLYPLITSVVDTEQVKNGVMPKDLSRLNKQADVKYPIVPDFGFYSRNFYLDLNGGIFNVPVGKSGFLKLNYVDQTIQGSVWLILVGADGFFFKEAVPNVLGTDDFKINFSRQSYGGTGFGGLKIGRFNKTFVAGGVGRGYVFAKGEENYQSKIIPRLGPFTLYREEFRTLSVFGETRVALGHIVPRAKVERKTYERISSGSRLALYGFNSNRFQDTIVEAGLEVIPSLKHDLVRFIIKTGRVFGDKERLLLRSDRPEWQVFLRIAF